MDAVADRASEALLDAYKPLIKLQAMLDPNKVLLSNAVSLLWRYLRTLEGLSVPAAFLDSEGSRMWGIVPLSGLRDAASRFIDECGGQPSAARIELAAAFGNLSSAHDILAAAEPPMWRAVRDLCVEEPSEGSSRIIIFRSRAARRLFEWALLSYANIDEADLRELGIALTAGADFSRVVSHDIHHDGGDNNDGRLAVRKSIRIVPTLIGIPPRSSERYLRPVLECSEVQMLLLPHEEQFVGARVAGWADRLDANAVRWPTVLSGLSVGKNAVENGPGEIVSVRLRSSSSKSISAPASVNGEVVVQPKFAPDQLLEATKLIGGDEERESEVSLVSDGDAEGSPEVWTDAAVELCLDDTWVVLFGVQDRVNVATRSGIEQRYVRSLSIGDRILLIHGQRKQDLYDLIVSRVHEHSALRLHIALLRRWREEIEKSYPRWRAESGQNSGYPELLAAMRGRGSTITSGLTVRFWVDGTTICPDDVNDVLRLGEVLKNDFIVKNHRLIHRARDRLAGIHRGLANRLNHWLNHQLAAGAANELDDQVVDSELGLHFSDFSSAFVAGSVTKATNRHGTFLVSSFGQVRKVGE